MKKLKTPLLVLVILVVIAVLIAPKFNKKNEVQDKQKGGKNKSVPITVITPKKGYFSSVLTVSGIIIPKDEVQITPKANGKLLSLLVEEGSEVKVGQLLGTIDHSELDTQLEQAQAKVRVAKANLSMAQNGPLNTQLKQAEAMVKQQKALLKQLQANKSNIERDLTNYQALLNKGIIPKQQVSTTQTQLEVLNQQIKGANQQIEASQQALKLLTDGTRPEQIEVNKGQVETTLSEIKYYQAQLANYNIISPINGVVTRKFLSSGSLVSQSTPIVMISTPDNSEIVLNIPENEIENIKVDQKVEIKTSVNDSKTYKGTIKYVYPNIDTNSRLGKVKVTLNEPNKLKLGMTLIGNIYTVEKNNVMTLPSDAIIKDNKQIFVYTVEAKKAVKKNIVLGIEEPDETEVVSGLSETDKVILKGNTFVNSNSTVEIYPEVKVKK